MADKTWKAVERRIAGLLGGERVPVSGRQRGESPDIAHIWLSLEVKHRKKFPDWLHDAMDQAVKSKKDYQLPTVVLHQNGKSHKDDFVVIRLEDFISWFVK
jgi:hypothetical protein